MGKELAVMEPSQILFIRRWARAGNLPRLYSRVPTLHGLEVVDCWWQDNNPNIEKCQLNLAGLTIAAQAEEIVKLKMEKGK